VDIGEIGGDGSEGLMLGTKVEKGSNVEAGRKLEKEEND
jgi:hypothetical protein